MEKQLFNWSDWDGDLECMIFYNSLLKVQIGEHKAWTKFNHAVIDWQKGTLQFCNIGPDTGHNNPSNETILVSEHKLKLSVKE